MKSSVLLLSVLALVAGCDCKSCRKAPPEPAKPLCSLDFSSKDGFTKISNYEDRTPYEFKKVGDRSALAFTRADAGRDGDPKQTDTAWGFVSKSFKVTPGMEYVVAIAASGNIPGAAYGVGPEFKLCWFDAADKPIMTFDALGKDVPAVDLLRFPLGKDDAVTPRVGAYSKGIVPANAVRAAFSLWVDAPNLEKGRSVAVENVEYYEHRKGEDWSLNDIDGPKLELLTRSPCADLSEPIVFKVSDATGVDWSTARITIDLKEVPPQQLSRKGDVIVYRPEQRWAADSVHTIGLKAKDVNGYEGEDWAVVCYTATPVVHPKYSIRDDGMMLKDGEPFFPLGICNVHACEGNGMNIDSMFKEFIAHGMNTAHTYMQRLGRGAAMDAYYQSMMDAGAANGVVVYAEPSVRKPKVCERRDSIMAQNLIYGRGQKATAFWGVGDDTTGHNTPLDVKRVYSFIKAVDPDVITISADVCVNALKQTEYVPYADVLIVENYPFRKPTPQNEEIAMGARTLDDAWCCTAAAGVANRSVMSMPQVFVGWSSWKRYPTKAEARALTFTSLACRARGLVYYTSFSNKANGKEGPWNDTVHKREFLEICDEVKAIMPSLMTRDAVVQPVVKVVKGPARNALGDDSVRCLLKQDGLLVAANTSHEPVEVSFELPNGKRISHRFERFGVLVERTR